MEIYEKRKNRSLIARLWNMLCHLLEWSIVFFLLSICLFLLVPIASNQRIQTYIVSTGSMTPTISVGALTLIDASKKVFQSGDIIAYTHPKNKKITVVHRIIGLSKSHGASLLQTKGDNNNAKDPWLVPSALVKGKLLFAIPYIGYLIRYVKTQQGFYLLIVGPSIILILLEFKKIKEGIDEEVKKKTQEKIGHTFFIPKFLVLFLMVFGFVQVLSLPLIQGTYAAAIALESMTLQVKSGHAPTLHLYRVTNHSISFSLNNVKDFESFTYQLTYDTGTIKQSAQGEGSISKNGYTSTPIILGTCSSGGVCVYDSNVHNVVLTVQLKDKTSTQTLTQSL